MIHGNLDYSKRNSAAKKIFVCVGKQIAVMTHKKIKLSSKGLKRITLENMGDRALFTKHKVSEEVFNINTIFRRIQQADALYEQTEKGVSYFYPEKTSVRGNTHSSP